MNLTDDIDVESPHLESNDSSASEVSGGVETLIHVIKVTRQQKINIFHSAGDNESPDSIIKSTGDILDTLVYSIKSIEDTEDTDGHACPQDELDMALIFCCHRGYTFFVQHLVNLGADVQTRDRNGKTALLICAGNGFTNMAKSVIIWGQAGISSTDHCRNTALIRGRSWPVKIVKFLLTQAGFNVYQQNKEGYTALMKAVEARDVDVIKLLLDSQENAAEALHKMRNCKSETVQDIADKFGLRKVVKLLLEPEREPITEAVWACDFDSLIILINCQFYDSNKICTIVNSALQEIIRKHERDNETFSANEQIIIQRLIEYGASLSDHCKIVPLFTDTRVMSYKVLTLLLKHIAYPGASACSERRDLFKIAAENGRIDLIQLLLKFRPTSKLHYSYTKCAIVNRHIDCARFLLEYSGKDNMKISLTSAVICQNPVHVKFIIDRFHTKVKQFAQTTEMDGLLVSASEYGNLEILGLLLDAGANVNCMGNFGRTPLKQSKNADVVCFLLQRGAAVNRYCKAKQRFTSVLTYFLSKDNFCSEPDAKERTVEALLKCGALVKATNSSGKTPLRIAFSKKASRNIVQMLLEYGADYNEIDFLDSTLLSLAVKVNKIDNILCLLQFAKYSKDILNFQTKYEPTAVFLAAKKRNLEVMKLLVDYGADVNITDTSGYTALSFLLSDLSPGDPETLSCITYLLDHGGTSYVSMDVFFNLIRRGELELVSKLIQYGWVPSEVSPGDITYKMFNVYPGVISVSPLCMALMTSRVSLARYLIGNLFLTKSDIYRLAYNKTVRAYIKKNNASDCLRILDELSVRPMSLFTLAFVSVQSAVGSTPGRQERISKLPLPRLIRDRLLFKH